MTIWFRRWRSLCGKFSQSGFFVIVKRKKIAAGFADVVRNFSFNMKLYFRL